MAPLKTSSVGSGVWNSGMKGVSTLTQGSRAVPLWSGVYLSETHVALKYEIHPGMSAKGPDVYQTVEGLTFRGLLQTA